MRTTFRVLLPGVPMMATTAEQLAFRDASLDAVTVAQAFHWFDHDRTIAELARAVRPGGRVGLIWNARDRSVDWVDQVWGIMDRVEKRAPWRNHDEWSDSAYTDLPGIRAAPHRASSVTSRPITPEAHGPTGRVGEPRRRAPARRARRGARRSPRGAGRPTPKSAGRTELAVPYRVDCFWFERR